MSDAARRIQQIDLKGNLSQDAFFGLAAGVSRHTFIEAQATRGADHILQLIEESRCSEAIELIHTPDWGCEVQNVESGIL